MSYVFSGKADLSHQLEYYEMWRQVSNVADKWYEGISAQYQCGELFAKWAAYNRLCAMSPGQSGALLLHYGCAPTRVLDCNLVRYGGGAGQKEVELRKLLLEKARAIPSFESL